MKVTRKGPKNPPGFVPLGGGYFLFGGTYQIEATPSGPNDPPYELVITVAIENGRPVINELHVKRAEGAPPITGQRLKGLPLSFLVRRVPPAMPMQLESPGKLIPVHDVEGFRQNWQRGRGGRRPSVGEVADRLEEVARIYKQAAAVGRAPTKEVGEQMQVSRTYAGKLVAKARKQGLLGAAPGPGKAGEVSE